MTVHPTFERLAVSAMDFPLSPPEAAELEFHLASCEACRALAQAYRSDAAVLQAVAFAPSPARVRAAVIEASMRPAPRRSAWELLAVAALLAILVAGLAVAAGALLQRLTDRVVPIELPAWMATDDWRIGGIVGADDGWRVGVTAIQGTRVRTFTEPEGWITGDPDSVMEFVLLSDLERLSGSDLLVVGVVQQERGVVLLRRQGVWSRIDSLDALHIRDAAVQDDAIWLLASPAFAPDIGDLRLAVGSIAGQFTTIAIDAPINGDRARIATAGGRLAIVGCSATRDGCEVAVFSGAADGTDWSEARLPATARFGDESKLQLVAHIDGFVTLVPSQEGGAQIWQSDDGRDWNVTGMFHDRRRPTLLAQGSTPIALGPVEGRLWIWTPNGHGGWQERPTDIRVDEVLGVGTHGDRAMVVGIEASTTRAWIVDVTAR